MLTFNLKLSATNSTEKKNSKTEQRTVQLFFLREKKNLVLAFLPYSTFLEPEILFQAVQRNLNIQLGSILSLPSSGTELWVTLLFSNFLFWQLASLATFYFGNWLVWQLASLATL